MVGNVNYPAPVPSSGIFDAASDSYAKKLDKISATETALQTLRAERDVLRVSLKGNLNSRDTYVDDASGGDAAKILNAAFTVQVDSEHGETLRGVCDDIGPHFRNEARFPHPCAGVE